MAGSKINIWTVELDNWEKGRMETELISITAHTSHFRYLQPGANYKVRGPCASFSLLSPRRMLWQVKYTDTNLTQMCVQKFSVVNFNFAYDHYLLLYLSDIWQNHQLVTHSFHLQSDIPSILSGFRGGRRLDFPQPIIREQHVPLPRESAVSCHKAGLWRSSQLNMNTQVGEFKGLDPNKLTTAPKHFICI